MKRNVRKAITRALNLLRKLDRFEQDTGTRGDEHVGRSIMRTYIYAYKCLAKYNEKTKMNYKITTEHNITGYIT